ncbi:hypothetical protein [Halovivax sp.]|uniref:hypothetical protein n=1 Tax=Halovivax sp. TaxID=1935978 RepID=UPI0025BC8A23|nr:hypothetical protein [Halovivax sp.]
MNRRSLLVATGLATVSLAGCLSEDADGDDAVDGDDGNDGDDPSGGDDPADELAEDPRVDEPSHEIDRPETPDDGDEEWYDDYLGETMDGEPSLAFERIEGFVRVADPLPGETGAEYRVWTADGADEFEELVDLDGSHDDVAAELEAIDFDERFAVVVASGWGSGSVSHRFARVEAFDGGDAEAAGADDEADGADDGEDQFADVAGVHVHGYYTDPLVQTDDWTTRTSVLAVERPDHDVDLARLSLTVAADRRVHVNSTEGVVSLDGDGDEK